MADSEEKKTPRVYKGEVTKISEIGPGVIAQTLPNKRKDEHVRDLPLFMVINQVTPYIAGQVMVNFNDPREGMKQKWAYLSDKFEVNVLTGRMRAELAKEAAEWRMAHLNLLQWPGGNLGADPEIFVVDEKDEIIPAFNFLGSKKKPNKIAADKGAGGYTLYPAGGTDCYWDGFQAEYTVRNTTCLGHVMDSIAYGLIGVHEYAVKYNPKARLSIDSVLPVPGDLLQTAADEHVEFGCMPSKNAYGLEGNKLPGRAVPIRFAGGHMHFGIGAKTKEVMESYVRAIDTILGVGCVSMFQGYDKPERRQFYGLAGEYRTPSHGLEYRTLSNAWLIHPMITNVVFEIGRRAMALAPVIDQWDADPKETIEVIQSSDVKGAQAILKRNEKFFKKAMSFTVFVGSEDKLYDLFYNGMGEYLKEPRDIEANWRVKLGYAGWVGHCEGPNMNWTHAKVHLPKKV